MADEEINKLPKTMPCPYHNCLPVMVIYTYREGFAEINPLVNYCWYCPECKKANPTPERWNAFGYGYTSQHSKSAARANWNNAVHRRQLTILKKAIKTGT